MKYEDNIQHMVGRTVASVEVIGAEFGRTYDQYICIVFTDGERLMLHGGTPYQPQPTVEEMKKAPNFFSPEEIAARVLELERESRRRKADEMERKRRELERLKKELGEEKAEARHD